MALSFVNINKDHTLNVEYCVDKLLKNHELTNSTHQLTHD